jgi:SAM-dependent methyltransferase
LPLDQQAQRFTVNGQAPYSIDYPQLRPDVQAVFWQRPQADRSGFMISIPPSYPDGVMRLRFADSMTTREAAARETIYLPDPALHTNLPDADRRFRVIGNRDPFGFLQLGCTDAHRIKAAYEAVTGKAWLDTSAVLDWGSGCGRVARHLAPELGSRFHGCDIDADNVSWCNANLPGTYAASKLAPPLPYADATFDIIYGISVFTHLRANWESTWLAELRRVLRPGGTMLMTVHGQTAIDFAALNRPTYAALMARVEREGLAVTSDNHQLDGFVEHPDEYVNVFHSDAHIQRVWSQYFSKIVQLKGYIFTHDLLVVTK